MGALNQLAADYQDVAEFFVVYIREAHAADSRWPMPVPGGATVNTPKTLEERFQVASTCVKTLGIKIPCVVDDMDNTTEQAYHGWPDRFFVVGKDGKIAFRGGRGPWGFKPDLLREVLAKQFPDVKPAPKVDAKKPAGPPKGAP